MADMVKRVKRDLSKFRAKSKNAKIKQVIGIIVFIVIVVICLTNDRAHSVLVQMGNVARSVSGTESRPETNVNTSPAGTRTEDPVTSIFGSSTPNYSPTNREGRAAEVREAEMQELRDAVNNR